MVFFITVESFTRRVHRKQHLSWRRINDGVQSVRIGTNVLIVVETIVRGQTKSIKLLEFNTFSSLEL